MNAEPQRLEDTHPEVARFIQDVCNKRHPYGVIRIHKGSFIQNRKYGWWDTFSIALPKAKQPGRNEKCPCGSTIKYKRCCGR